MHSKGPSKSRVFAAFLAFEGISDSASPLGIAPYACTITVQVMLNTLSHSADQPFPQGHTQKGGRVS